MNNELSPGSKELFLRLWERGDSLLAIARAIIEHNAAEAEDLVYYLQEELAELAKKEKKR